ncbi:MAG: hypothetical protein ACI8PD_001368, partial [Nitrospinales bacterium]
MTKEIKIFFSLGVFFLYLSGTTSAAPTFTDKMLKGYELAQDWDLIAAQKLSHSLLKKHPESGDAHFLSARIEFLKGNYERAWEVLERVG